MILFVHGWGYDAGFWDPVRKALAAPSAALDLGYFGDRDMAAIESATLLVGHSLGFLWLARQPSLLHLPLVGINAFPRFLEAEDFAPAVSPRVLARMQRRFVAEPGAVLAEFWQRAGAAGPDKAPVMETLSTGLDQLAAWDERENVAGRASSLRLIAGETDAIVPASMTRMAFKNTMIDWLPGGHALPQTHAAEVARLLHA